MSADHCDICDAPQMVLPNGDHACGLPSREKCEVRDGRFVEPCNVLLDVCGKAVEHQQWSNFTTKKPSRSFVTVKSGKYQKQGMVLSFCPFCGTRIDAAVQDKPETTA